MLQPHITKKQQEILLLLYRFRFLTRKHFQTLLHHKDEKRINEWLRDLTEKNYVFRIVNTGSKDKTIPIIYGIAKNSIAFLKTQPACKKEYIRRLYKEDKKTKGFIERSLFIADIYMSLLQKYLDTSGFMFYTQSDFTVGGIIKEIFPLFVYRKMDEKPYYIAEIFREKTPRYALRSRISIYVNFFTKGEWIKNEQSPNILFVCPNDELEQYIFKKTQKLLKDADLDLSVCVSTIDQIRKQGIEGEIWKKIENHE